MKPELVTAVGASQQLGEDALFTVFLLRCAVLDLPAKLLNKLESLPVDDRLMYAPENDVLFFGIHKPFLVLEGFGIGFEIDEVSAILDTSEDRIHSRAFPVIRIFLPFPAVAIVASGLPVVGAIKDFPSAS